MNIQRLTWTCLLMAAPILAVGGEAPAPCPIAPCPKQYHDSGVTATLQPAGAAAIVIGAKATEPERYAAESLQSQIERRFKRTLPIHAETDVPATVNQRFLLGQIETSTRLEALCRQHEIDLSGESPGDDGFVIRCLDDGPRQVILIGGSNPRGVIYGQNALFDLLRQEGDRVVFPVVSVRDWPSIAWRGRPHSVLEQHLVPGALDAYLRSRINFTDVRDDPDVEPTIIFPARKASMGFPAGRALDEPPIRRMIRESHRRGLFVYGTVSCGVKKERVDDVIETFQELIALGVDGLWISFDDVGAGDSAPEVIRRVVKLGAEHGMTGRKIAITPPLKEYQTIDMEFNHKAAGEWGLADAQWMFTRVPCTDDAATARRIGIRGLPGWWHNLVNFRGGFLHNGGVGCSLRADGKPGYLNMQPLSMGWHNPQYDEIRDAENNTRCALLWGIVGGWPEEYQVGALGLWAWDPARHDWLRTREAVYRLVYGPSMVETAGTFDDRLSALKDLFELPPWRFWPNKGWPCRLKNVESRAQATALLDQLERLLAALRRKAPDETAIDPARLESVYLEPIEATLAYARKMALLEYPEYSLADFERTMMGLIDAGKLDEAERLLDESRDRIEPQLARIEETLAELKGIDQYVAFWNDQLAGMDRWKERAARRRVDMTKRFEKLIGGDVASLFPYKDEVTGGDLDALFAPLAKRPAGNTLAELGAADWLREPCRFSGEFCAGPFAWKGQPLVAIAYPRRVPSRIDDAAEVDAEVAVPEYRGRLMLDAFVNDTRLENRYPKYRYMQLWANDRLVWEEDVAPTRAGKEWISLDVTEPAGPGTTLKLRFRVVDKRGVGDHLTVTFLGPVLLRALAE
ncbi:MAG TPA: hypothetical protein VMY37_34845 [Thermoguttaceae bacterium]|nr:hypothetical protein [Thermoguttaceae bacterium]